MNGARTPLRARLDDDWTSSQVSRFLADEIDELRRDIVNELGDLVAELASLRRTFWVFIGALFTLAASLIAVAAAVAS